MPLIVPNFIEFGQTMNVLHPSVFWRPVGDLVGQSSLISSLM